jgi:hypothetical protein
MVCNLSDSSEMVVEKYRNRDLEVLFELALNSAMLELIELVELGCQKISAIQKVITVPIDRTYIDMSRYQWPSSQQVETSLHGEHSSP